MEDDEPSPAEMPKLGADLIIPIFGLVFAVYYIKTVWSLPWQASAAGFGIVACMVIVGAVLGIRFYREARSERSDRGFGDLFGETSGVVTQRVGLLALSLMFIFAMEFLGFTISLFLFVLISVLMLAGMQRIRMALLLATTMSLGGYSLFIVLVAARFPHGPFERFAGMFF